MGTRRPQILASGLITERLWRTTRWPVRRRLVAARFIRLRLVKPRSIQPGLAELRRVRPDPIPARTIRAGLVGLARIRPEQIGTYTSSTVLAVTRAIGLSGFTGISRWRRRHERIARALSKLLLCSKLLRCSRLLCPRLPWRPGIGLGNALLVPIRIGYVRSEVIGSGSSSPMPRGMGAALSHAGHHLPLCYLRRRKARSTSRAASLRASS